MLKCNRQNFLKATERISRSGAPLLHEVIPTMDILTRELKKALKNTALLPCVHAGVSQRLSIIDKYYSKTDESIMWKTAMSTSIPSFSCLLALTVFYSSPTSPLQARLFPQSKLADGMDQDCRAICTRNVDSVLQTHDN